MEFTTITEEEFNELEEKFKCEPQTVPKKCFVAKCSNGDYLAMDNLEGECFVDKFNSMILVKEFFANNLGYDDTDEMFTYIHKKYFLY